MRSMAPMSCGGGATFRAWIGLAQRQKVEQHFDQRARIAGDVAAVGKDLAVELVGELRVALAQWRGWPGMQSAAKVSAIRRLQRGTPSRHFERGATQVADLARQVAQEARGRTACRRRAAPAAPGCSHEMMRRATISGRQAIRMSGALQRDPFVDQRAGVGARRCSDSAARRWRSQPKPCSVVGPFLGRRLDLERRAAVADHDLAGEGETAGSRSRARASGRRCAGPAVRSAGGRP